MRKLKCAVFASLASIGIAVMACCYFFIVNWLESNVGLAASVIFAASPTTIFIAFVLYRHCTRGVA